MKLNAATALVRQCREDRGRVLTGAATPPTVAAGDAMSLQVDVDGAQIAAFCQRHHIRKLAFFGSVLRSDFGPDSDVDVLVEFEPGFTPGLRLIAMERELSALLAGRRVDLVTPKFLNPRIRERVLAQAETQYAA